MKHLLNITTFCLLWTAISYGQLSTSSATEATTTGCPDLAIQLTTPKENNTFYAISYCNVGEAVAENSYLEIYLDSDLSIVQATEPLQYKSGGTYRFLIGDVAAGACGSMYFQIPQSLIKSHCLYVFAATALPCTPEPIATYSTRTSEGDGTTTTTTSTNDGSYTLTQAELDLTPTGIGTGSYSDPIFEDHVFLDFVPTWDSLMSMFSDLQTYSFDANDSFTVTSTLVVVPVEEELPLHAMASYCRRQAATVSSSVSYATRGTNDNTTQNMSNSTDNTLDASNWSIKEEQSIVLAPNPVQQEARLEVIGYGEGNLQVEVFSVLGQQVAYLESQDQVVFFQVGQWNRGIYFYRLHIEGQFIKSERFVVE